MGPDAYELHEEAEHAHAKGNKGIGLTIAFIAVFSAFVSMLVTENNTNKVIVETKIADWWAYSHSKASNAQLYEVNAKLAELNRGGAAVAEEFRRERDQKLKESVEARLMAQDLERESAALTRKGNYYSVAELFLQFSVVLCSVALLTEISVFWKSSFVSMTAGLLLAAVGVILR
jgi:aminopeptidase N